MAAAVWTYSDWTIYEVGNASRISRLRLHIQEVSDSIKGGSYATAGKSHDLGVVQEYLKSLRESETAEAVAAGAAAGTRALFTRGRAI